MIRIGFLLLPLVTGLCGCAPGTSAIVESIQYVTRRDTTVATARLNPDFRYLRATVDGRAVLLALGYVDSHPRGPIQVWYSAEREVLRLQNGRIVGATGLPTEWRSVIVPTLPAWTALARVEGDFRWTRVRDVMPGYRFGIRDDLVLRVASPPSKSALQELDPRSLTWFEEHAESLAGGRPLTGASALPPGRYAVSFAGGAESVVYGEQCLARDLCFSWQVWPAAPQNATKAR